MLFSEILTEIVNQYLIVILGRVVKLLHVVILVSQGPLGTFFGYVRLRLVIRLIWLHSVSVGYVLVRLVTLG